MTEENKRLRVKLSEIELAASTCLSTQPDDDEKCNKHLKKTLSKIAEESAEFLDRKGGELNANVNNVNRINRIDTVAQSEVLGQGLESHSGMP